MSGAPPRRMRLSIEECLFGPEKKCPSNVWDAVLGGIVPANSVKKSNRNHSEDDAISAAPPVAVSKQQSKPKEYLGIDEFDANPNGRWARPENVQPHVIPIQELRRIASQGIPDQGSHRSVTWRVLLGGLPYETVNWKDFLLDHRQQYRQLVSDLFVEPQHDGNELRGHQGKKLQQAQQARRRYEESHVYGSPPMSPISAAAAEEEGEGRKDIMKKLLERRPDMASNSKLIYQGDKDLEEKEAPAPPANGDEAKKEEDAAVDVDATPRQGTRRRNSLGHQLANAQIDPAINVSTPRRRSLLMDQEIASVDDLESDDNAAEAAAGEADEQEELKDEPNGFGFEGQRPALTHTASEWIRRKSESSDDLPAEVLEALASGDDDDDSGNLALKRKDSEDDTKSIESLADIVPMHIQEEWKKTGRDVTTLDSMAGVDTGMNTLLVTSTSGTPPNKGLVSVHDDPLSTDSDSKWFQFFENASLLDEIRKDVVRTHPDLYFFLEPENNLGQRRYAALERILFVWAKLNRGVRYVQGMNEIVGTIYYVLANDDNEVWACEAEADTYFLFHTLMTEMRDIFVPDLDEADTGIQGRISNMTALLSLHDPEVRCHLVDIGIDPAFYAIRWLTTLLSREFLLPDTIRLWDSMFASTHKENFMRYVCVTMVMIIRGKLLKGDFSTCLRLLQAFPTTNIDSLLEASRALWIYESQVTLACHKGGISLHQALCTITPPPAIVMAYGLPGGVARTKAAAAEPATPRGGGGFFQRANAMLGSIGHEVANVATRSRSRSRGPARGRNYTS